MALREGKIAVKFSGGIETMADAKQVPATKLLALENGVFTRAVSIVKRFGYRALSTKISESLAHVANARRLATRDSELVAFTRDRAYSYLASTDRWSDAGACVSATATDRVAIRTGTMQTMPDHAVNGGITLYAWEDSRGGVWWAAIDSDGRVVTPPRQAHGGGSQPRCVAVGDVLHLYFAVVAENSIYVLRLNPARPSMAVISVLVEDLDGNNPAFDAEATSRTGKPAVIAWKDLNAAAYRIGFVDVSGVLGSPITGHPSVYRSTIPVNDGSPIAVAYNPNDDRTESEIAVAFVCDASYVLGKSGVVEIYATASGAFVPIASTEAYDAPTSPVRVAATWGLERNDGNHFTCWTAWEEPNTNAPSEHYVVANFATIIDPGTEHTIRSVGLASRAFRAVDGTDAFCVFVHDTTFFNVYVTMRLSDFAPAGRHLAGAAAGLPTRAHLSSAQRVGDVLTICLPYRERLVSEGNDRFTETGLRKITLNLDDEDGRVSGQLGRGLYVAGACPLHYDGVAFVEQGFHVGPEKISATQDVYSGPPIIVGGDPISVGLATGVYEYRAWYEATDAQGEIHRGPESIGTVVTVIADGSIVTLTLPTCRITKHGNVRICVARSRVDDDTELFRVTSSDPSTVGSMNGFVPNDPTVDTVTFVDGLSDGDLAGGEPIYTTGGVLSNDPTSLGSVVANGKNRLFFSDASDPNVVHYSQELAEGYGVEIAPELRLQVDPYGGPVTALGVMDDAIVVFKQSSIYAFGGLGPTATGDTSQTGWTAAELLTSDVGCNDPASIVITPVGLMFKSAKGIYLVGRDRSVSYIGAPVEGYNSQRIRRASLVADQTQVVFLTDSGKTLLYDYLFQQWSTFTNHEGRDAAIVDGVYHYLRTDDRVFVQTPGLYSDAGQPVTLRIETAWIKLSDILQGFSRFWNAIVLGERKSAHQLRVQFRTDYQVNWTEPVFLDATAEDSGYGFGDYGDGSYGGAVPEAYQWRIHLGTHGESIQFRFQDDQATGTTGPSFELSELVITGGMKGNVKKPFAASRSK